MTVMVHYLYEQKPDGSFEDLGKKHGLLPMGEMYGLRNADYMWQPTWLDHRRREQLDWGTIRVYDLTRDEVLRLFPIHELTLVDRMYEVFVKIHTAQNALLNSLDPAKTFAVDWVECC